MLQETVVGGEQEPDLSRLVDVEDKNCPVVDSKAFSGKKCEHASSWTL